MKYNVIVKFNIDSIEVDGDTITVGIRSKREHGKANMELVKKMAKHFDVPQSNVRVIAGLASRKKIVEVIR